MRPVAVLRGLASLLLFVVFALGSLLISPVVFVLRHPSVAHPVVRGAWRLAVLLFQLTRLIRLSVDPRLRSVRGSVVVANHPSLIDVVLIVSAIPRTLYVAKSALRRNPVLGMIVRSTALPDDESLPEIAAPYLKAGWNVLVFPEGTRSPRAGGLNPMHRGAAQLVLRTGASLACVRIDTSRRLLAKGQPAWDMGERTVDYTLSFRNCAVPPPTNPLRAAATELTARIRSALSA